MIRNEFENEMERMRRIKENNELSFIGDIISNTVNESEKKELSGIFNSHYESVMKRRRTYEGKKK